MLLDHLSIHSNGVLKREIKFKPGINLILDESVELAQDSGNSIGKTTALRAIDFCLGAKPELFFQDKEFKVDNKIVRSFFEKNDVVFTLSIKLGNNKLVLKRNISLDKSKKAYFLINDKEFRNLQNYTKELKFNFFLSGAEKPSFRQIISRFIRSDNSRMTNALKTLHSSTSAIDYETLNLFLFGYGKPDLLSQKQYLKKQKTKQEKSLKVLKQDVKLGALKQSLVVINNDIQDKEKERDNFQLSDAYQDETERLERLKNKVSQVSIEISKLETRKMLTISSIDNLKQSHEDINTNELESIYKEAEARIGNLSKSFEDSLNFHNQMITRKIEFMEKEIPNIDSSISELTDSRDNLLKEEATILSEISNSGSLADLQILQTKLNELYENRGKTAQAIEQIEEGERRLESIDKEITSLNKKLNEQQSRFDKKLEIFNAFFSSFTEALYGEEYVLYTETKKDQIDFMIAPVKQINNSANPGEGTKKSLVTAFDFAFMSYIFDQGAKSMRFIAHDGIEAIHQNQVTSLFDIASNLESQYIVSTLRKSVEHMGEDFIIENKVLQLSENNKFFNIENSNSNSKDIFNSSAI